MNWHRLTEATKKLLSAASALERERALKPIVGRLEKFMAATFRKQGRLFSAELAKHRSMFTESSGLDRLMGSFNTLSTEMEEGLVLHTTQAYAKGTTKILGSVPASLRLAFDLDNPRAVKFLEKHAADMVTAINDTTRAEMRALLTQATEEGWSYNQTAKVIRDRFDGFAESKPQEHIQSRAHLVAVTEARFGYERGNRDVAKSLADAGLEMEKSWLTSGDDRVTDECMANEDEGWIPIDEQFPSGDDEPPRFPGCRCTCLYQAKGAVAKDE